MPPRSITSEDLLKLRVEITKEQMDARHEQASRLQTSLINYQDNLEHKIDQYISESKEFHKDILDRLDKLDGKFASKWTENVILWTMAAVGVAIIGALMSLILIK